MLFKQWSYNKNETKTQTKTKIRETPKKMSNETRAKNQEHIKHELRYIALSGLNLL